MLNGEDFDRAVDVVEAEIERLHSEMAERERVTDFLLTENERLRKELGECQAGWATGTKALQDNERLRTALEQIRDGQRPVIESKWGWHIATLRDIARAALESAPSTSDQGAER